MGQEQGHTLAYIQPGKPRQNAYVERYNRTVRHEWPDHDIFERIDEVQQVATEWLWSCSTEPPHIGKGGVTPARNLRLTASRLRASPRKNGGLTPSDRDPLRWSKTVIANFVYSGYR